MAVVKKRKTRLKKYMVKYCETVHHFYYKYVDAQNYESADNKANLKHDDWNEHHNSVLEDRELVEVYNCDKEKMEYQL